MTAAKLTANVTYILHIMYDRLFRAVLYTEGG